MCDTCGCGEDSAKITFTKPGQEHQHKHSYSHEHSHSHDGQEHEHTHDHAYDHSHANEGHHHHENHVHPHDHNHSHDHGQGQRVNIEQNILGKNDLLAERNRGYFDAKNIVTLNLVSSPGSGKTSLLERTISDLNKDLNFYIIEGDQQTLNDAERIQKAGAPVIQVNTGNGCHLDSDMINRAVKELNVADDSFLMIENVGNLVCPSLFDLGEQERVVIISVTEGEDKPIKYPTMFQSSTICVINKTDLLPYLDFDVDKLKEYALQVNHHLQFFEVSAKTGEGLDKWYEWLKSKKSKAN